MNRLEDVSDSSPFGSSAFKGTESPFRDVPRPQRFSLIPYAPIILTLPVIDFLAPLALSDSLDWSEAAQMAAILLAAGTAIGQFVLFSVWAALGPEPWYWRLPGIVGVMMLAVTTALL